MTFRSISVPAAGTAPIPIPSFIPDTTISTRVSASRGRMATRFCASAPAFTTRMARKTTRTFRSRIPSTATPSATLRFPTLSYPLTPFLQYAEAGGLGVVSPRDLDRNRKDDYVAAWTASVQRKLPLNILGTASYLGNKGTDVLTTTYVNLVNPQTGVAPYPAFGPVSWRGDVGNSTFHALQLNARRAFQNGFLLSANYMWSHSINDGSIGGGESDTPQDSFCRSCDKASSDDDVRQVFNLSAVYQLPFGAGKHYLSSPGVARTMFGGWTLSAIGTAQTGLPFNITIDSFERVGAGRLCDQRGRTAELCAWRLAHSARRIHSAGMGKPGRVFHACLRDVWQSGPQRLSRSRHFGSGSRIGEGCLAYANA